MEIEDNRWIIDETGNVLCQLNCSTTMRFHTIQLSPRTL